jgi:hypothetical protein
MSHLVLGAQNRSGVATGLVIIPRPLMHGPVEVVLEDTVRVGDLPTDWKIRLSAGSSPDKGLS